MSTDVNAGTAFLIDCLAASGFAILHPVVAVEMRPDLWDALGAEQALLVSQRVRIAMKAMGGLRRCHVRLEGISGEVELATRSMAEIEKRVEFVTGRSCTVLRAADASPLKTSHVVIRAIEASDDRFHGRVTVEGPRTCGDCDRFSAGSTCMSAAVSGIERPVRGAQRRCLAYQPKYAANDQRTGVQLWPELVPAPDPAAVPAPRGSWPR